MNRDARLGIAVLLGVAGIAVAATAELTGHLTATPAYGFGLLVGLALTVWVENGRP